ncbi:hypothetical protein DL93DRAFT_2107629 [Clavulina sp. PMI_390]|nr:hypothetical protein DL93DRAFT_2107629 [Clavulina sp. PMI_390]
MGKILKKGERGAARAYVTRSAAVKKLQISLADFRRLCILKGIFPREPKHRKRANKGNSINTSFYYAKDVAYLAHEPVLQRLRDHKAFAKKLSRALGRGEWSSAKSLEDHKPTYRLDHIIKERYPTFIDALRDIDDALCLITLFASLPSSPRIPASMIESCARLASEWQVYVMHTHSLRKVFLSIKGIYFQAEVQGQLITWLVPYMFTQAIPTDVDVRVMLTFLELYQTLLGFVFYKLYSDAELVYPPPIDIAKEEQGSGVDAFRLQAVSPSVADPVPEAVDSTGRTIKVRDVRKSIREITSVPLPQDIPQLQPGIPSSEASPLSPARPASSPSLAIFSLYTFYLAPGCSRPLLEFCIRAFGGRVGWPASMGLGSPIQADDTSITHVIIDRPVSAMFTQLQRDNRKLVQPQWVVDSINAGMVLPEGPYGQGASLPPHLSPFGEEYQPLAHTDLPDSETNEHHGPDEVHLDPTPSLPPSGDVAAFRTAELAAERAGVSTDEFDARVGELSRKGHRKLVPEPREIEMNKMLMSNKQRKLYERVKHSEKRRNHEVSF